MAASPGGQPGFAYRPELDSIRGVAVLVVLLQHFVIDVFRPGANLAVQVGVTLFFVLSGFLITRLLTSEYERSGQIQLARFLGRRLRRLVPALVAMVAIVWIAGVPGNPLPALTYTTNWWVTLGGIGDIGAYHHTWTLAIELQFYVLWALAFGHLITRPRPFVVAVLGLVIVASTLALPWTGSIQRIDALLAGVLLAVTGATLPRLAGAAGWIAIAVLSITDAVADPGLLALATVASAAIVASPGPIAWRPLVALGTISYGVYVWSLPVRITLMDLLPPDPSGLIGWSFGGIALTILIAAISARWIERPWRQRRDVPRADVGESAPALAPAGTP